nr:thermonuclease family protein [Chthonobacter albigriseus]
MATDASCGGPVVASGIVGEAGSAVPDTGAARVDVRFGESRTSRVRLESVLVPSWSPAAVRTRLDAAVSRHAGGEIRVHASDPALDRRGRSVGQAEAGGTWIQQRLLEDGLVVFDGSGGPCAAALAAAEDRARAARRGIWAAARPMSATHVAAHVDLPDFVVVESDVFSVGSSGTTTYLNFGRDFSSDLTVSIGGRILAGFPPDKSVADLQGRTVRVRGWAEVRAGADIRLEDQAALDVIKE